MKLGDIPTLILATALTVIGLIMTFDTAYPKALAGGHGAIGSEFRSQILVALLCPLLYWLASRISVARVRKSALFGWFLTSALVLGTIAGPLRLGRNGSDRWIKLGPVVLQPSELAKVAVIVYLAAVLAAQVAAAPKKKELSDFERLLALIISVLPALWVLAVAYMIDKQPDFGTAAVLVLTAFVCYFLSGINWRTLALVALVGCLGAAYVVRAEPYRAMRFSQHSHRYEAQNIKGSGYQAVHSEAAIASGYLTGKGIGSGVQKRNLPEATSDFALSTVGEEFGLLGSLSVLALLGGLVYRLCHHCVVAAKQGETFCTVLFGGVAAWIGVQGCVNMLQTNGTLPPIGVPFPFVSAGGSSLAALWIALGLCDAAVRRPAPKKTEDKTPQGGSKHDQFKSPVAADRRRGGRDGGPYLSRS